MIRRLILALLLFAGYAAAQDTQTGTITAANAACTPQACIFIVLEASRTTTVAVQVAGAFTGTLKPEKTVDGTTWVSAGGDVTVPGITTYSVIGNREFRLRASALSAGTPAATLTRSAAASGGAGSPTFADVGAGTNANALVVGTGGSLGTSGSGTITATDSAAVDGRSVTITSAAAEDVLVDNGSGYVNAQLGLTSRADNDGTVALATTDRNDVVNVGHATANAVSIAEAGAAAGNGFIAGWKTTVCTTGAGLTTITPTTSTINGYATLTLRQHECAVIRVPTEADTNYLAQIDGGQFIEVNIELFGPGTATATGDGKAYFLISEKLNGTTLIGMRSQVYTAGTTNTTDIGLDRCAAAATGNVCSGTVADMLSVVQTIDTGENSSDTAATAVTINASNAQVSTSQVLRFNVDAISTTPAQGLQVTLRFRK